VQRDERQSAETYVRPAGIAIVSKTEDLRKMNWIVEIGDVSLQDHRIANGETRTQH
jgi:hypothetical protein